MKKISLLLIAVTFVASIAIASNSETSAQSEKYEQCDSYNPTKITCYVYNKGNGSWNEWLHDTYLHTNQKPWKVYMEDTYYDVTKSDRCEYRYMFVIRGRKVYFSY